MERMGNLPGHMAQRAAKLDTIFAPPATVGVQDTLFVDLQSKFWNTLNSYTHGGSMAINRALVGYDEESTSEMLRSTTSIFILFNRRDVQASSWEAERRVDGDLSNLLCGTVVSSSGRSASA
jgi:hypothetical protein